MCKIIIYKYDGTIVKEFDLTEDNLMNTSGMMSRCTLKSGVVKIGFSDPTKALTTPLGKPCNKVEYSINLWTWKYFDEEKHAFIVEDETKYDQVFEEVKIDEISVIESIMYSNPRWGGRITNKFEFRI